MYPQLGSRGTRKRSGQIPFFITSQHLAAPNATVNVHRITAFNPAKSHIDFMLSPKGNTGGFMIGYDPPDNTTVGGNKRGARALDMQMGYGAPLGPVIGRNTANQVAGDDDSYIFGGFRNRISHSGAGQAQFSAIVGGYNNYIASSSGTTGVACFLGGGRDISVDMSGGGNPRAYIGGNTIVFTGSDTGGSAGAGGGNVTFNSPYCFAAATQQGTFNTSSQNSTLLGSYSQARSPNQIVLGGHGGGDSTIGASQASWFPLTQKTSDATPTLITPNGTTAFANNISVPATYGGVFQGYMHAESSSNSTVHDWHFEGGVYNVGGTLTMLWQTVTSKGSAGALAAAALALGVDTVNRRINITGTGIAATTIRWSGWIHFAERN
jgi:hypothetical protein